MNHRSFLIFYILLFLNLTACSQEIDKGDDKLTEGRQQIEVQYKGSVQTVYFDNLDTEYPINDETPVVYVEDIVLGSGLVNSFEEIWLNFIGEDGYHPIGGNCIDYAPVSGDIALQGYIERGTTRLIWPEPLDLPRCLSVRDVVKIEIADDPEDLPLCEEGECWSKEEEGDKSDLDSAAPLDVVNVHYNDSDIPVDITELKTTTIADETVVTVASIIQAAELDITLDDVIIDIKGNDNWPPGGTCPELPAPSDWADKIGITTKTSTVVWHASLGEGHCGIRLMNGGHIYLEDSEL